MRCQPWEIITVRVELIEFLIPVTILVTAVSNLFKNEDSLSNRAMLLNYFYAVFFGLIHGLRFPNYLKSILGKNQHITSQLFAFNIGLESGQIIIVGILLLAGFILLDLLGVSRRDWKLVISSAVAGIALILIKDKIFW